jgi:hypothetical protein
MAQNAPTTVPAPSPTQKEKLMPLNITAETPRRNRTIAGFQVLVPSPYIAGHPLTEGEAAQLNQVLAENVSNNLRKKLEDGYVTGEGEDEKAAEYTPAEAQAKVDEYMQVYEPGVRTSGGGEARVTDPVEREARKIAKQKAVELVKQHGMKAKDVDLTPIIDQIFEANRELLMAEGKKIVRANEAAKAKGDAIDITGINLNPTPAEPEPAPAG